MKKKINVNNLFNEIKFKIDYFICSVSFEERCYIIANNLQKCTVKNVNIFCNSDFINHYSGNEDKILSFFPASIHQKILINTQEPASNAIKIFDYFDEIDDILKSKFFIDTTTFTHETLLVLLKVIFLKSIPLKNIIFAYINAADYSINEIEIEKKWLSKGIGNIRNVIGFSGFMNPLKKNHLIVLVGIEIERTKTLIDKIEPNSLSLGVSIDNCSNSTAATELNQKNHKELCELYLDSETFEFSVLDPHDVYKELKRIVDNHMDCNIIIAAMNNKISTVGVGFFANSHQEVQVSYATALQYNIQGYTIPGEDCYLFTL